MSRTVQIRVIPNAKKNIIKEEQTGLKVYLSAPPIQGKANKMLIKSLARYFNIRKSQISIIKGEKSRAKVVQIEG